ncbi:MAG: DUF4160 domain-containing protein [Dehalococcoidia bacterium]|nr:DUF4160 domain-containing protein [Dehalococcoidia bacterium]
MSPSVLCIGPYRFGFYAKDRGERPHVHVWRDAAEAKFWLGPVKYDHSRYFREHELRRIEGLVVEHEVLIQEQWDAYFTG